MRTFQSKTVTSRAHCRGQPPPVPQVTRVGSGRSTHGPGRSGGPVRALPSGLCREAGLMRFLLTTVWLPGPPL